MKDVSQFGPIWGASGTEGVFGEGYWFHYLLKKLGLLSFKDMAFVAKTTTIDFQKGNMPLNFMKNLRFESDGTLVPGQEIIIRNQRDVMPQKWLPDCIYCDGKNEVAVNAVGLSGPGAKPLLKAGFWQQRMAPFFLSFMSIAKTPLERAEQLNRFLDMLGENLPSFQTKFGLQINWSCPNVGLDPSTLIEEVHAGLTRASQLSIPLGPKINILVGPKAALEISNHDNCDVLITTNTIPYGQASSSLLKEMEKAGLKKSPLEQYGGGGISGECLRKYLLAWLTQVKEAGITKPINAGGGITRPEHVDEFKGLADSVSIGSMVMFACKRFQPWIVQQTIQRAHQVFGRS